MPDENDTDVQQNKTGINEEALKKVIHTMKKDVERLGGSPGGEETSGGYTHPGTNLTESPPQPKSSIAHVSGLALFTALTRIPRSVFLILVTILFLAIVIPLLYGGLFREEAVPSSPKLPEPKLIVTPLPLVPITDTVSLELDRPTDAFGVLDAFIREHPQDVGKFTRLLLREKTSTEYMTLQKFAESLGLAVPAPLQERLEERFTLALWGETNHTTKVVLILKGEPRRSTAIKRYFELWEETMEKDLSPLLALAGREKEKASEAFANNRYKNVDIRYLNFDNPEITIDYAIVPQRDLLIITTSRESIYAVIDLVGEAL